ncbi:MAG: choice-of-anchor W domain-containing protein [Sphingomonadaceae bacterium]
MSVRFLAATAAVILASPASAALTLTYSIDGTPGFGPGGIDAAFELPGGYLDAVRGFPVVNNSALVPLERAVVQVRANNIRNELHLPNAASGIPVVDGGTGVTSALTNSPPFVGNNNVLVANGVATDFTITRVGNILTFTLLPASGAVMLASDSRTSIGLIDAFSVRIRSTASGSIGYSNLMFSDSAVSGLMLADISASGGGGAIRLFEGIAPGDFTLSGTLTRSWTGSEPNGSNLATQIKFLTTGGVIPEPGTWAMLIVGFGLVGAAMRRQRLAVA